MLTLKVYPWTALLGPSAIFLFQKMFYNHQCTINLGIEWVEKDSPDASFKSQGHICWPRLEEPSNLDSLRRLSLT